ncbi:MAG: hypothetical protein JNM65_02020 [Verrucomicrobiaceae bacterium]|nr:hypothetical protein [Verrucomicrobiaceae bacterium]
MKPACRAFPALMLVIPLLAAAQESALRPWKDAQGRVIQAAIVSTTADSVTLRMADGKEHQIPLARLSAEDQAFVKNHAPSATPAGTAPATAAPAAPAAAAARIPVEKRVWPANVLVPSRAVEIQPVEESAPARRFVYRSEAFEFTSQAKLAGSVMKEVARTFESTRALVTALPWGIVCRPPEGMERYQAALYETRNDYIAAGGPANSGGVYSSGDKIFKVPFPSIGLEMRGKTYFKNDNYDGGTLIHEITHQMMHNYLPFLPKWVIEGTAEYTEMIPYNAGKFRTEAHKIGIRDHVQEMQKRGYALDIGSLETHMTMNRATWDGIADSENRAMGELYFRSVLLVYFFCHLDGPEGKKGQRFLRFMDAVHGETEALRLFFADPRVKRFPDGRFQYPKSFPPPDMSSESAPFKHLPILLDDRGYPQIAKEIAEGYRSIGLKVSVN